MSGEAHWAVGVVSLRGRASSTRGLLQGSQGFQYPNNQPRSTATSLDFRIQKPEVMKSFTSLGRAAHRSLGKTG